MTDLLLGKSVQAHLYICRIPLDQVPLEEEACAQWLYELYQKKVTMPHITYVVCLKSKCTDFLFMCLLDLTEITSYLIEV